MQIPLTEARPGMVLSQDITIVDGGVLLNKHEKLDDALILLLKNCKIATIDVFEDGQIPDNDLSQENNATTIDDHNDTIATTAKIVIDTPQSTPLVTDEPSDSLSDKEVTVQQPPADSTPPGIRIIVENTGMAAHLILEPAPGMPETITPSLLHEALAANAIVYGINSAPIDDIVDQWTKKRERCIAKNVAVGVPPRQSAGESVKMVVNHLSSRADCDRAKKSGNFNALFSAFPDIEKVTRGAVIAEKILMHPATPGMDIFGNKVLPPDSVALEIIPGENAVINSDNTTITAECDGIAYMVATTIGVIPVDFNGSFSLEISPDRMIVKCNVIPPGPGGILPKKETLLDMLEKSSVCFGISESDIDTLIGFCTQGTFPAEPVVIATGLPPVNGADGTLTYHFKTDTSLVPAINNDGSADYKSVNVVTWVEKGSTLVTLVPPTAGQDGSDVFGKHLPALGGKPIKLPAGKNTSYDPANNSILLADIDGIVRITGGLVEVTEGFVVEGDVDFSTGNIDYARTIIVNGDIKAGFDVHAGCDLQVNGTIEDCKITAGGSVLCKFGFVGQGKGCIEAKGDVNLSFVKNQCVKSFKTINIAKEVINTTLFSRSAIIAHGKPLSIAGGVIKARSSITAYSVGNHTGIHTHLEVGVDYLMFDELVMIEQQISETTTAFKSVADAFTQYQKFTANRKNLSAQEQQKFKEVTDAFRRARQKLTVLEERKTIVTGKIYSLNDARIVIEHAAYPGTLLKFGERQLLLNDELIGPKTIVFNNHEIRIY